MAPVRGPSSALGLETEGTELLLSELPECYESNIPEGVG